MVVVTNLALLGCFIASLALADGILQIGLSIASITGILVFGLLGLIQKEPF